MYSHFLASSAVAVLSLVSVLPVVFASPSNILVRSDAKDIDVSKFASKLSETAQVLVPDDADFTKYTTRWSNLETPTINVVVVAGTEKDVSVVVKHAYKNNIPILAYNGHHGSLTSLGGMKYGIEIYLPQLNTVEISKDGTRATIGGGVNSHDLTNILWAAGKQTVTGTCECVSYMGPGLGGGHGWLQGHHGLIADQWLEMNVVLANGQIKKIKKDCDDLFWGMQGAGHNFGIVTSVTTKIYDIVHTNWAIETIIFSGDQVEQVYDAANEHLLQNGTQAEDIINWSYWQNVAELDAEKPVVIMYIIQEGVDAVDRKYTDAFHTLKPLNISAQTGTYHDLGAWTGIALDSPPCQDFGFNNPRFPIYLKSYNSTAQKKAYDLYASAIGSKDSPYYNSIFMFEDYSTGGVRAISDESTAFGFRQDLMLAAPLIIYAPNGTAQDAAVNQLGQQLREIIREGTGREELHTYVNYAYGTEGPESWYGYDSKRQDRLKALKRKYDPKGVFSFYAPIA